MNVRISQDLLTDVRSQINRMRQADCKLHLGQPNLDDLMVIDGSCKELVDIVWGEHLHLKDQIPSEWVKDICKDYNPHIYVAINFEKPIKFKLNVKGKTPFFVPPRTSSGSEFKVDKSKVTGHLAFVVDIYNQHEELVLKWHKIQNDVITYLKSAKSLNSALKNWADLKAFIPEEYLDRVAAKPERTAERKKAEEMLASIDRNLAVTSATLVKLAS